MSTQTKRTHHPGFRFVSHRSLTSRLCTGPAMHKSACLDEPLNWCKWPAITGLHGLAGTRAVGKGRRSIAQAWTEEEHCTRRQTERQQWHELDCSITTLYPTSAQWDVSCTACSPCMGRLGTSHLISISNPLDLVIGRAHLNRQMRQRVWLLTSRGRCFVIA